MQSSHSGSKWFWYISRPDELFLDIDREYGSVENHLRSRLQGAIESGKLLVKNLYHEKSQSGRHEHIIITLQAPIPPIEKAIWEIILHSDLYRGCNNVMRIVRGVGAPTVLISRRSMFFFRSPDDYCFCSSKHKPNVMAKCPTSIKYRGENGNQGFFGKPSKNPCKFL